MIAAWVVRCMRSTLAELVWIGLQKIRHGPADGTQRSVATRAHKHQGKSHNRLGEQ